MEAVLEEAGVMGVAPLWVGLDLGAGVVGVVCSAVLFCPFCNNTAMSQRYFEVKSRKLSGAHERNKYCCPNTTGIHP